MMSTYDNKADFNVLRGFKLGMHFGLCIASRGIKSYALLSNYSSLQHFFLK